MVKWPCYPFTSLPYHRWPQWPDSPSPRVTQPWPLSRLPVACLWPWATRTEARTCGSMPSTSGHCTQRQREECQWQHCQCPLTCARNACSFHHTLSDRKQTCQSPYSWLGAEHQGTVRHPTIPATTQPAVQQTIKATTQPAVQQTIKATTQPAVQQTIKATTQPAVQQTIKATTQPAVQQTIKATTQPAVQQTIKATTQPAVQQTIKATTQPAVQQTIKATTQPAVQQTIKATTQRELQQTIKATTQPAVQQTINSFTTPQNDTLGSSRHTVFTSLKTKCSK